MRDRFDALRDYLMALGKYVQEKFFTFTLLFAYERWLGQEPDPHDLLVPFPADQMAMWPVSTRVNNRRTTTPRCWTQQLEPNRGRWNWEGGLHHGLERVLVATFALS